MTDLTVDANHKIDVGREDIIVSTAQAVLIICRKCGDTKNVSLHETPDIHSNMIHPGTVQYPAFKYCRCNELRNAPNAGGVALREIRGTIESCKTIDEVLKILDHWIRFEEQEKGATR